MFYKVPKALFKEEKYKPVSTDAKMLYGLLLDRMHLSAKNGWTDKRGRSKRRRKSCASGMKRYADCSRN